ncbi:Uncharacterised protein [Escherichia coli]|uniref:Uncharacterized protein n=1 Tax=Escherichia coli TaxID=562 RepID=A0A376VDS9_ECOLX|nr:Uncharacterised protein [Escherichia coli]
MPMDSRACTLAGDQTRGGKAPGLRAAAGECRHAKRGSDKGHRFDIYAGTPV